MIINIVATCQERSKAIPDFVIQKNDLLIDANYNLPKHFHVIYFSKGQDLFFLPEGVEPQEDFWRFYAAPKLGCQRMKVDKTKNILAKTWLMTQFFSIVGQSIRVTDLFLGNRDHLAGESANEKK